MRKMAFSLLAIFAVLCWVTTASAHKTTLGSGDKSVCKNGSWAIQNTSETAETTVVFNPGPYGYHWGKPHKRSIAPGGFQQGGIAILTTFENKGPAPVTVNCQRRAIDFFHDWKVDSGSGMTYQPDYHMDHVQPGTYIEPGLGMPEGTERGIAGVTGSKPEDQR